MNNKKRKNSEKEKEKEKEKDENKESKARGGKERGPLSYLSSRGEDYLSPSLPYSIPVIFEEKNGGGEGEKNKEKAGETGLAYYLHLFLGEDEKNEKLSQDENFEGVKEYISSKLPPFQSPSLFSL